LDRWMPCVVETRGERIELGHRLVDEYLELVRARARRNTLLATAYDLRVFFGWSTGTRWRSTPRTCWGS
jgi:integrase/recombinase XerD